MAQIDIDTTIFTTVIIVLLLVIGFLLVRPYLGNEDPYPEQTEEYCDKNIIPENIVFGTSQTELEDEEYRTYDGIESTWRDGTPISTVPPSENDYEIRCVEKGDYFYCKDMYYSKTPINPDYAFGQTRIILIDLVLDKTQSALYHFQQEDYKENYHWAIEHQVINGTCREL